MNSWEDRITHPCPVCGLELSGPEEGVVIIRRHRAHAHAIRKNRSDLPFPADVVVTVGSGSTQYKLWHGSHPYGVIRLVAIRSGKKLETTLDRIHWDGKTFWARDSWLGSDRVFEDMQEG